MSKPNVSQRHRKRLAAHGIGIDGAQNFPQQRDKSLDRTVRPHNPHTRETTMNTNTQTEKPHTQNDVSREPQVSAASSEGILGATIADTNAAVHKQQVLNQETNRICHELWGVHARQSTMRAKVTSGALTFGLAAAGAAAGAAAVGLLLNRAAPSPTPEALPQVPVPGIKK